MLSSLRSYSIVWYFFYPTVMWFVFCLFNCVLNMGLYEFFSCGLYITVLENGILAISSVLKILFIFIIVAFFTLVERKILGAVHRRRGPALVGIFGLLQPIADAVKLFLKELLYPVRANTIIFIAAPWWILTLSVFAWFVIPFHFAAFLGDMFWCDICFFRFKEHQFYHSYILLVDPLLTQFNVTAVDTSSGVLILLAISSLNVYGIILAGWSSNSKYAFLGGLRSAAQMISYEVSLGLTVLPVVLLSASLSFIDICLTQQHSVLFFFPLLPSFVLFLISALAETNRAPFDLPEAEAELVAGYNVEYSAITFAMFFLGEYSNMLLMAIFTVILFIGGVGSAFYVFFVFKVLFFCFFFIIVRASVPRFRYDQLMQLCWKVFLPVALSFFSFALAVSFFIWHL